MGTIRAPSVIRWVCHGSTTIDSTACVCCRIRPQTHQHYLQEVTSLSSISSNRRYALQKPCHLYPQLRHRAHQTPAQSVVFLSRWTMQAARIEEFAGRLDWTRSRRARPQCWPYAQTSPTIAASRPQPLFHKKLVHEPPRGPGQNRIGNWGHTRGGVACNPPWDLAWSFRPGPSNN